MIFVRRRPLALFCVSTLLVGISACSKDDLPKYSSLDRLRILAIVADTPEIQNPAAGTVNVQITPYLSDIGGSGDVQLEIQSCLDPGISLGAEADCANAVQASAIQTLTVSSAATATEGLFGNPERTGAPQSGAITVPLQIPPNLLQQFPANISFNGVSYLITLNATSGSQSVKSFRRILFSTKSPNTNPILSDLLMDSVSLTQSPSLGQHSLSFATAGSPESYQFLKGDGGYRDLQEDYELTWFVSDGVIENYRARTNESVEWKVESLKTSHKPVVVGVLRDGRGGMAVKVKTLTP